MGQSVVLIAPRRFGKTSLLMEALLRLKKQGYYTAFIDVFANAGIEMLSSSITEKVLENHKLHKQFIKTKSSATAMLRNLKLKTTLDDFQFLITFTENNKNEWELLSESIDFVDGFSKKHNKQIVCAYDEFGDIQKFSSKENISKLFRSKIQQHKNSTYIFSGSYESVMQNLFINSKSPFYRLARIIRLEYLEQKTITKYLFNKLIELNISLPEIYIETLIKEIRGHPYYAQLAFQQIVLFNTLESNIPKVETLLTEMLSVEKDYLEKVWEDISNNKEYVQVLRAIALEGKNIYKRLKSKNINIARAIKKLEGMGLLFKDQNIGYYLSDPLLEKWIKSNN